MSGVLSGMEEMSVCVGRKQRNLGHTEISADAWGREIATLLPDMSLLYEGHVEAPPSPTVPLLQPPPTPCPHDL